MKSLILNLAKLVEDKVVEFGSEAIMTAIASSPAGAAFVAVNRFTSFVETRGASELEFANINKFNFKLQGQELLEKMQNSLTTSTRPRRLSEWQKTNWAKSRQEFLDDAWKHDWRSQPRNRIGEWIEGRLAYPALSAKRVGKGKQKTSRERRRINRYRRFGRAAARSIKFSGD